MRIHRCLLVVTAMLCGCGLGGPPGGPVKHESQSIALDKTERVHTTLKMNAGELSVRGGAAKLLEADFTYNVDAWQPELHYQSSPQSGTLDVVQPGPKTSSGNAKNSWDIRLNDSVPMDLRVQVGAGDAKLDLGSLNLRDVDFQMGAGDLHMDLRGKPDKDYTVRVMGGAGDAVIQLPKDVGITATVSGGLGDISVSGMHKSGDKYVNDAYGQSSVTIKLQVTGGVGSVKLED